MARVNHDYNVIKSVLEFAKDIEQHPEWYTHYPEITAGVGFNFAQLKNLIPYRKGGITRSLPLAVGMQLALVTDSPNAKATATPWETAINKLYLQMRAANSGKTNTNPVDLSAFIHDYRVILAMLVHAVRGYELLFHFSAVDTSIPKSLFMAAKLDYDDWQDNAGNIRFTLASLINRVETLITIKLDLFERTKWLFGTVFLDSEFSKPTYYLYTPMLTNDVTEENSKYRGQIFMKPTTTEGVYSYSGVYAEPAAGNTTSTQKFWKWADYVNQLQSMIDTFIGNPIFATISGDLLKAFGTINHVTDLLARVTNPNPKANITYDEYQLNQWHNATVLSAYSRGFKKDNLSTSYNSTSAYPFTLAEQTNLTNAAVKIGCKLTVEDVGSDADSTLAITAAVKAGIADIYINSYTNNLAPGQAVSITRLVPTIEVKQITTSGGGATQYGMEAQVLYSGTEVAVRTEFVFMDTDSFASGAVFLDNIPGIIFSDSSQSQLYNNFVETKLYAWTSCDWAPKVVVVGLDGASTKLDCVFWDYANYANPNDTVMTSIHTLANMSLLWHTDAKKIKEASGGSSKFKSKDKDKK